MITTMMKSILERLTFHVSSKRKAQKSPQASISLKNRLLYCDSSQVIGTKRNYQQLLDLISDIGSILTVHLNMLRNCILI